MKLIFQSYQGPLEGEWVKVSRWVNEAEKELWKKHYHAIPKEIEGDRLYVTTFGAPKPGGTGPFRIDFYVLKAYLGKTKDVWFQIFTAGREFVIFNVQIFAPDRQAAS